MKRSHRSHLWVLAVLAVAFAPHLAFAQGVLTPPGPPGPTMKTLDQIDTHVDTASAAKRIPINATTTPGDANSVYIITQPGSYYMTGNLNGVGGKNGIKINSDNVTVDLNGFAVIGVAGSLDGINSAKSNLGVRNGSIRSWGNHGVNLSNQNQILEALRLSDNGASGLSVGQNSVVKGCAASNNGSDGFALSGGTLTGCTSNGNTDSGFSCLGASILKDCAATSNRNTGFFVRDGCIITGCLAAGNTGVGFYFRSGCLVSSNHALGNGGDGFKVDSFGSSLNRIDGNSAVNNVGAGIRWVNDLVIRNNCYSNSVSAGNYNPASGPAMGPIQAAGTATNPFANF